MPYSPHDVLMNLFPPKHMISTVFFVINRADVKLLRMRDLFTWSHTFHVSRFAVSRPSRAYRAAVGRWPTATIKQQSLYNNENQEVIFCCCCQAGGIWNATPRPSACYLFLLSYHGAAHLNICRDLLHDLGLGAAHRNIILIPMHFQNIVVRCTFINE